ncbi:MAG: type B 50S ribosomal protein L31 [Puniceicoccales bacterium]|jgi:large subunit ribosomal protein L31|nr:type B 50S ribosomal protein L31 [Puniceicoccales bacterium]
MKKGIHPEREPVCFIDISTGRKFVTVSSLHSKKKDIVDGVECNIVHCDVTSDSHPAYTGGKHLVDTAGRVERFKQKFTRCR